ncbi:MAG: hypothetical protein EHM79_02195 [Geobacter sp.]|nr:MAG: hypothetical protein EHM79_02195 [Geobacter sp.]
MLTRRRVIAAKIEGTEGTAETITVTDGGILVINPAIDFDFGMNEREAVVDSLSKLQPVPGKTSGNLSFRAELKGPGAAYSSTVKPALGKFLRACGFAETVVTTVGVETVTYAPASTGIPCLTMWSYEDGVIKKLKGCRGNVKFSGKNGEICFADFEFTGVYDGVVDGAIISPTFEATDPPVLLSSAFTIGAYAANINSFDLDMGNEITLRESINTATGYISALVTDRRPTGKFDPEMVTVATYDFFGKWKAGTSAAMSLGSVGATQYNRFKITAPKVVTTKISDEERAKLMVAGLSFSLAMTTGDDEVSILFD